MRLTPDQLRRIHALRREVRLNDARPNDGRCGNVAAAIAAEFGWPRECGYLRLRDGSVSWVHCWNRADDDTVIDATSDQFGDLWVGDTAVLPAGDGMADHYLPNPRDWTLTRQDAADRPTILVCHSDDDQETQLIRVDDPQNPWHSLTQQTLELLTGWTLDDRLVRIATHALRARLSTAGHASTSTLIRPLVTESIQHFGRRNPEPWIANEFMEQD